jgi:hypothetical protein
MFVTPKEIPLHLDNMKLWYAGKTALIAELRICQLGPPQARVKVRKPSPVDAKAEHKFKTC